MNRSLLVALLALASVPSLAPAENWAQWRGPSFNGSTTATSLPVQWDATNRITWKTPLPGPSAATPAIWGDRVFVTSTDAEQQLLLLCLERSSGRIRWQKKLGEGDFIKGNNNLVSPSPATDGQRVYALFGSGDLAALDFEGRVLWSRRLDREFGKFSVMWLYGSSPLLFDGRLYIQVLQRNPPTYSYAQDDRPQRESFLLCIDPATGKDLWRQLRTTDAQEESMESYATPIPYLTAQGPRLAVVGGDCVTAHDAATGAEIWRCYGLNPKGDHWRRVVPSAVVAGDLVFACGPKRESLLAIRDGGTGTVTDTHLAWKHAENCPDVCTPLLYEGRLYALDGDRKVMTCLDPASGKVHWSGAMPVEGVTRSSPVGADGKIYTISEAGLVTVLAAGDRFQVLSSIAMGEAPCRASVAVADRQLFIRTARSLYCIGEGP